MSQSHKKSTCPDWHEIFLVRPDLEAPGYQEAKRAVVDKKNRAESERIKALMQEIQKEKTSYKNKARTLAKRNSKR